MKAIATTASWLCARLALFCAVSLAGGANGIAADLPDVIARIKPSIAAIGTFRATGNPQFLLRGTGFAVEDGSLIATNAHVVADQGDVAGSSAGIQSLVVQARIGGKVVMLPARVVATDLMHDLALLRVGEQRLPPMQLGRMETVREGQSIAFSGFPIGNVIGLTPVTHRGIISAITPVALPSPTAQQLDAKMVRQLKSGSFDIFQLDATAYPGNSGGPLFDTTSGEVLGVISMVLIKGTKESIISQPSGITYAVPVSFLKELILQVK